MRVTRINKRPEIQKQLTKPRTTLRKIKRLVNLLALMMLCCTFL